MVDTRIPRPASAQLSQEPEPSGLLNELLWLARDAQERLASDPLGDRGYVLGQRNTYARAAGIVAARDTRDDPALVADRVVHALAEGTTDLRTLHEAATHPGNPERAQYSLEWVGPRTFDARYGDVPGIDEDFGMRWGAGCNQRISLRRAPGAAHGMLYAYDPTWDEYALLQRNAPTRLVTDVYLQAVHRDEHLPLENFAHLLGNRIRCQTVDLEPSVLAVER